VSPSTRWAAVDALERLPEELPEALVVVGAEPGLAVELAELAPQACVRAPGATSRLAVAAGVTRRGRPAIALADRGDADLASLEDPVVVLTEDVALAKAWHRLRRGVLHPVWPEDVAALLHTALSRARPQLLLVGDVDVAPRPAQVPTPAIGQTRVHAEGGQGAVVASGPLVPALRNAVAVLARRGLALSLLEPVGTVPRRLDPAAARRGVLVGPALPGEGDLAAADLRYLELRGASLRDLPDRLGEAFDQR